MAQISERDIGKRVTIRLRASDGFRDLVGHLVAKTAIQNRHGEVITFDPTEIYIWKEIEEITRTATSGAPFSIRINELEKLANSTWRAKDEESIGGWLMRADDGNTKRANSALVLNNEDHIDEVIGWYRARNLTPIVSLMPDIQIELDEKFQSRGFNRLLDLNMMVKDEKVTELDPDFQVSDQPSPEWLAVHNDQSNLNLLKRSPAKYLELYKGSQLLGIGRVSISQENEDWVVLSRIWVSPEFRGKGYGKRVLQGLESLAGDRKIALQVSTENEIAINLYRSVGYQVHHLSRFRELSQQINLSQDCHC